METTYNNTVFLGTELKLNIHIEPINGISITSDKVDFRVDAFCNSKGIVTITKSEAIETTDQNSYIVLVDTAKTGLGSLKCKITLKIEDADFDDDNKRTEIALVDTGIKIIKA